MSQPTPATPSRAGINTDAVLDGGEVLPGFTLPLRQLFDELDFEVKP